MITRRSLLSAALAAPALTLIARPAFAASPPTFAVGGVAIRGADPVAFFTEGKPVIGSASHALMYEGAMWHFASADNMAAFTANPDRYAPKYGGYCAFAMSRGAIATTVPEAWSIVDDKLYLNFSVNVRQVWNEDIPGNIRKADGHWPSALNA